MNERHAKWLTKIQDLVFEIEYVPGLVNVWADLLSRPPNVEMASREILHNHLLEHRNKRLALINLLENSFIPLETTSLATENDKSLSKPNDTFLATDDVNSVSWLDTTFLATSDANSSNSTFLATKDANSSKSTFLATYDVNSLTKLTNVVKGPKRRKAHRLPILHDKDEDDFPLSYPTKSSTWHDRLVAATKDENVFEKSGFANDKLELIDDIVYYRADSLQVVLPRKLREEVIRKVHNLGHYGIKRTRRTIAAIYKWKSLSRDVEAFVRSCPQCQKNKVVRPKYRDYCRMPCTRRFKMVHVDIVGPLDTSQRGHQFILTMMDRFSRWVEAVPLTTITARTVTEAFFFTWISRYGCPSILISDRGKQFKSDLFNSLLQLCNTEHRLTVSYHPQTNGQIERMHSTLKEMLRCVLKQYNKQWDRALPTVLLAMRTAINEWGVSPSIALFGEQVATPTGLVHRPLNVPDRTAYEFILELNKQMDFIRKVIIQNDATLSDRPDIQPTVPVKFTAKVAYLREPVYQSGFYAKYRGPYLVLGSKGTTVTLEIKGKPVVVNIDQCRQWHQLPPFAHDEEDENTSKDGVQLQDLLADVAIPKSFSFKGGEPTITPAEQVLKGGPSSKNFFGQYRSPIMTRQASRSSINIPLKPVTMMNPLEKNVVKSLK